jgi:hypothetical protein
MSSNPDTAITAITAITLERNCFGCAEGQILTLRRDGHALLTLTGNARQGTQDRHLRGPFAMAEFDALAGLATAGRFLALDEAYDDGQTRDGAWSTLTVVRAGIEKRVFCRDGMAPPALQSLLDAVGAAKARIRFTAVP